MRSYVVKRLAHLRHSRRRRIASPARPSRESITLSSRNAQKGHFTPLILLAGWPPASPQRQSPAPLFPAPRTPAIFPTTSPGAIKRAHPLNCSQQTSPAKLPSQPPPLAHFLLRTLA